MAKSPPKKPKDPAKPTRAKAARPDAILTFSTSMTQAVQWATKSIPVVFAHVSDPIADGVVKDYARPEGNTTGVSTHHRELLGKRFELLRELLPKAKAARPDIPVIMITAYGDAETKRKALESGAEALLTKPIDFGLLRSEIETRVERLA